MNNSEQAKKGFQTFVLTLSVSLILFSIIYYLLTSLSSAEKPVRIDEDYKTEVNVQQQDPEVAGTTDVKEDVDMPEEEAVVDDDPGSVFGKLAAVPETEPQEPQVLAGADEVTDPSTTTTPTETTTETETTTPVEDPVIVPEEPTTAVPETGSVEVTVGLIMSLIVFVLGIWSITRHPKVDVRESFEKSFF